MADHVAAQLRAAVVLALTGLATTGSRVFPSRAYPVRDAELPCILVYTPSEQATTATLAGSDYERLITVQIDILIKASAAMEDEIDQIRKEIEVALSSPLAIGGTTTRVEYRDMTSELRGEVERPTGAAQLTFEATLYTAAASPDVIIGA